MSSESLDMYFRLLKYTSYEYQPKESFVKRIVDSMYETHATIDLRYIDKLNIYVDKSNKVSEKIKKGGYENYSQVKTVYIL